MAFRCNKVLCIVRNPLDVLVSYATLCQTMSHSAVTPYNFAKDYPQWWDWWIKFMCDQMSDYFDILMGDCIDDKRNPIHICRFEDLSDCVATELSGMMKFCLDLDDLSGTNMERRLEDIKKLGDGATATYKLKAHS